MEGITRLPKKNGGPAMDATKANAYTKYARTLQHSKTVQ